MSNLTDREIMKASEAIDKALASATRSNPDEVTLHIARVVSDINNHIADVDPLKTDFSIHGFAFP